MPTTPTSPTPPAALAAAWDGVVDELRKYDDPHSVVNGPEFDAVIEHEDYPAANGQTFQRARVQWINDPNGGSAGFVPMGATEVQSAKERLRIAAAAVKAKKLGQSTLAPAPFEEEKF